MEPKKATDILLELEAKVNMLLSIVQSQDLNLKVLSNKLNTLIDMQKQQSVNQQSLKTGMPSFEAVETLPVNNERQIHISAESKIPVDQSPKGFRRTSRPETYSGDDSYISENKYPVQIPQQNKPLKTPEVIVPNEVLNPSLPSQQKMDFDNNQNSVPIIQRVVDGNGKSIFLADVEIYNSSNEKINKSRTNGTGKWMATLPQGNYKVIIRKRDQITKEKVELSQDILVDGKTSPLNLQTLIFK